MQEGRTDRRARGGRHARIGYRERERYEGARHGDDERGGRTGPAVAPEGLEPVRRHVQHHLQSENDCEGQIPVFKHSVHGAADRRVDLELRKQERIICCSFDAPTSMGLRINAARVAPPSVQLAR